MTNGSLDEEDEECRIGWGSLLHYSVSLSRTRCVPQAVVGKWAVGRMLPFSIYGQPNEALLDEALLD